MSESAFAAALLNPDLPQPDGLLGPDGRAAGKRFDVYRNNVAQGLGKALEAGFPAVLALVGPEFFRAMALEFLREHPPTGRIMMLYGAEFPAFIAEFPPAQGLGYLSDVARLEQAIRESYHAADTDPLPATTLAALPEAVLLASRFQLAPSLKLIRSQWPVGTIHAAATKAGPAPLMRAEAVLVTRPDFDPIVQVLPEGGGGFVAALMAGGCLAEALADVPADFDLAAVLSLFIQTNALIGVQK